MGISDFIADISKNDVTSLTTANVIRFAEENWGLNMNMESGNTRLRPVQKLILKCFYDLPLDNKEKAIIVRDHLNEVERFHFTETEYLHFLYNEGRTNIKEPTPGRNELVLVCGRRSGKTLAEGTLVMTPVGPVPIETLKVGDSVYGYNKDGSVSETKVKNFFDHGVQEVVDLINHNCIMASCTPDHRWLTTNERETEIAERSPSQFGLRHGEQKAQVVRKFVKVPCGKVHEPHAYAIGAILGDGCCRQSGRGLWISSGTDVIPKKVASILGVKKVKRNHPGNYNWILYGDNNRVQCNHYDEWCRGRYAHEKTINLDVVKSWDRESCLNFMAGHVDTDGSVSGFNGVLTIRLTMQAKGVVEAFQYLFLRLFQYNAKIFIDDRDKYVNGPCYGVNIHNNAVVKQVLRELDPYLVSPSRKWKPEYECYLENNTTPNYIGVKLGKRYKVQTYDIEVDNETNLYLLANGMVTHNSKLGSIVCAYEGYKLIKMPHPQKEFGITDNSEIYLSIVATSTEQAELLFNDVASYIDACRYFDKYKNPPTLQYMKLRSFYDIQSTGVDGRTSIIIRANPCSGRGLRGPSNIVCVLDELAHFLDATSSNKSDNAIYDAITPSTLSFGKEARILNLSSPLNKQGKLYELYQSSFHSEKILMFQIPTWEMYPEIDSSELRERFRRNPDVYWCEIGAQFSDTVKSWMSHDTFIKCIDPVLKPKVRGLPRVPHFMGVDIGLKKDQTAISVLHIENVREQIKNVDGKVIDEIIVPKYELDWQEVMQAGVGEHEGQVFLDFDNIADRIVAICNEFHVEAGLFDQYNGVPLKQRLDKLGMKQFEMMYFDRRINSEIYNNFMLQTIDGKLRLYDEPPIQFGHEAVNKDSLQYKFGPFVAEVLELQSQFISKYITLVAAPAIEGKHDDRSDSFVRALWKATQYLTEHQGDTPRPGQRHQMAPAMMDQSGSISTQSFYNRKAKYRSYASDRPRSEGDRYSRFAMKRGRR